MTLAARLSEDPTVTVAVIEAGELRPTRHRADAAIFGSCTDTSCYLQVMTTRTRFTTRPWSTFQVPTPSVSPCGLRRALPVRTPWAVA